MIVPSYSNEILRMHSFSEADWMPHAQAPTGPTRGACPTGPPDSAGLSAGTMLTSSPQETQACVGQLNNPYTLESTYLTPHMPYVTDPNSLSVPAQHEIRSNDNSTKSMLPSRDFTFNASSIRLHGEGFEDFSFGQSPFISAPSPTPSLYTSSGYNSYGTSPRGSTGSIPHRPQLRAIAPDPSGLQRTRAQKRGSEDDEEQPKRSKRINAPVIVSIELNQEERLLLHLKDEENLAWKEIAARFSAQLGKNSQVPALQMRYKRLREKMRAWTDVDVSALNQARDYWEKFKWEIIANKMLEFGVDEKWPAKYCMRKWDELHPEADLARDRGDQLHVYSFSEPSSPEFDVLRSYRG